MAPKVRFWNVVASFSLLAGALGALPGCGGGGGDSSDHLERPVVRSFSPFVSPINFNTSTLTQNPTFTNGTLTVSTDTSVYPPGAVDWSDPANPAKPALTGLRYQQEEWRSNLTGARVAPGTPGSTNYGAFGRIVIYFQKGTDIDPASILSSDPADPLDHNALLVTKYTPGVGNEILPISGITIENVAPRNAAGRVLVEEGPRIVLKPANFARVGLGNPPIPLADGQYTVRVGTQVRNSDGDSLNPGPVFMTFTVGLSDGVSPFVVNTDPADQQTGVGAGVPPPAPPTGVGASQIADVRTNIFGATSPDIRIEFSEGIRAVSVNEQNIRVEKAGQNPFVLAPAPNFPQLKSQTDGETLPSNGHEVIFRVDPLTGGLPFQSAIQVTVVGLWDNEANQLANPLQPDNSSPIQDLAGNGMELSKVFTFFTIAPPDVPQNPFPEYAIWWSAIDRVGCIDTINQVDLANQFNGTVFPQGVPRNVLPAFTDTVSTSQNIPGFRPTEMIIDQRTSAALCSSFVYVMSPTSGQIVIVNTRTSLPVALINTPTPGGIAGQFAPDGANVLLVTNSSANTITIFDFSNITPGTAFLNGPIFIQRVLPTGNTPRAITISDSAGGLLFPADWNRDGAATFGPSTPVVLWADFTDGVVNTYNLGAAAKSQSFALGANAAPNDVVLTPCFGLNPIMFGGISQGGLPNQGKVAYYVAGPGCVTGSANGARPDNIVGDLSGFDGPAGLDEVLSASQGNLLFVVAESGSQANRVSTLSTQVGAGNLPRVANTFTAVGANPTSIAHRPAWANPCIGPAFDGFPDCFHDTTPSCHYNGTEQDCVLFTLIDGTETVSQRLYICSSGASQITVVNMLTGSRDFYSPISIPGVTRVASTCSQ